MVAECAEEFLSPCQERGLELSCEIESGTPPLCADPVKIRQAFLNLIGNAMKFTPSGGRIVLGAKLREGGRDEIEIFVRDSGIGVSPAEQEKIFEKFYQIDASTTRSNPGLGLGLSLVKSIALAHGGQAGVESRPGEGSRFSIRLPVLPAQSRKDGGERRDCHAGL
jgi:signal transduction histidine kinase